MTPAEFATYVRFKTRTSSTTFTDAQILALMAVRQDELAKAILEADEDILLIPQYTDLVVDQRDYPLPQDILSSFKRVEAKLDETNYIELEEFDMTQYDAPITTEADITARFNNSRVSKGNLYGARFDLLRKSLMIYSGSIVDVTDGLRVWCNTWPTAIGDLSATSDMSQDPSTTTHGIPREMHRTWATGVIIDYKESREKPIPLSETEKNYKDDKAEAIASLKPANLDREVIGDLPPASSRGNDGQDY